MSMASLQSENLTIVNVVIDWFGTTTGMLSEFLAMYNMHVYLLTYILHIYGCDKAGLDDKNG